MQSRHWCNQARSVRYPWAICAIRTYARGAPKNQSVAFDIYSEAIPSEMHSVSIRDSRYASLDECTKAVLSKIAEFSEVSTDDAQQVSAFIEDVMLKGLRK